MVQERVHNLLGGIGGLRFYMRYMCVLCIYKTIKKHNSQLDAYVNIIQFLCHRYSYVAYH